MLNCYTVVSFIDDFFLIYAHPAFFYQHFLLSLNVFCTSSYKIQFLRHIYFVFCKFFLFRQTQNFYPVVKNEIFASSVQGFVHIATKLEYQPYYGFEKQVVTDIAKNWMSAYIRPKCTLVRGKSTYLSICINFYPYTALF